MVQPKLKIWFCSDTIGIPLKKYSHKPYPENPTCHWISWAASLLPGCVPWRSISHYRHFPWRFNPIPVIFQGFSNSIQCHANAPFGRMTCFERIIYFEKAIILCRKMDGSWRGGMTFDKWQQAGCRFCISQQGQAEHLLPGPQGGKVGDRIFLLGNDPGSRDN